MAVAKLYQADLEAILARRHDNGADLWATPDGGLGKGSPFATVDCALMLSELGLKRTDPLIKGIAELFFDSLRDDGRVRLVPSGTIYPCHTATGARILCRLGYAKDRRLKRTFEHLLDTQHDDGGWRCNACKLGRSAVTDASNPGPTLEALDAFRFTSLVNRDKRLDRAVKFLLEHWTTRKPLGPCEFGIGTLFMKVEYPFFRYNLFFYVYVLSFYAEARKDKRFRETLGSLESRLVDGQIVVENPKRQLARFALCKKGQPNALATKRYREIVKNLRA